MARNTYDRSLEEDSTWRTTNLLDDTLLHFLTCPPQEKANNAPDLILANLILESLLARKVKQVTYQAYSHRHRFATTASRNI